MEHKTLVLSTIVIVILRYLLTNSAVLSPKKYILVKETKVLRIFEAFAGIGAQRKALENIGKKYEVVGMAEWFVPAIISYQAIHNGLTRKLAEEMTKNVSEKEMVDYLESLTLSIDSKKPVKKGYWSKKRTSELKLIYCGVKMSQNEGNIFDIHTLHERKLNGIDLLTYSFPCQDLSQQGIQKGMRKGSGTRSGLLWEIEKALDATPKKDLPKYLLMENVMALMNSTNETELKMWMDKLESLGYENDIAILNAGDFGSAQARRRVFMISHLGSKIKLPIGNKKPKALKDILDEKYDESNLMNNLKKYKRTEFKQTKSNINKCKLLGYSSFNSETYIYHPEHTGPTLTASGANSRIKILDGNNIRKLNASEAYRYMGFETKDFNKINNLDFLNTEKIIYTCGNSISVEVLEQIMCNIN